MPIELVRALAAIKGAAATVNGRLRVIPKDVAGAIHEAAAAVVAGTHDDHFPVDVFQTGSGTSTNMNVNEVLARLASDRLGRPVHANDEVNASQSSNDVFPSAIRLAACRQIVFRLVPALDHLHAELRRLAKTHAHAVKAGRTHLMDAAPVTFGQEMRRAGPARSSWAAAGWSTCCRGWASCLSVGPRSVPGSTRRPASPAAVIAHLAADSGPAPHRGRGPLRGPVGAGRAGRDERRSPR